MDNVHRIEENQDDHGFDAGTYGLQFYLFRDEEKLLEAYMKQLGGTPEKPVMPDSTFGAEFAMDAAKESLEEGGENDDKPFTMEVEEYKGDFSPPF